MGRSFYYGTDHVLNLQSLAFARLIALSPESYGLTQSQSDEYALTAAAYDEAYRAAIEPVTRTRGVVAQKNACKLVLRKATARLAKIIAGTVVSEQQKIDLGLSIGDTTRASQPPGTPDDFRVALDALGRLTLRWTCKHPTRGSGTLYQVFRQIDGVGDFVYLGHSGTKRFLDRTIPAGAARITYRVRAVRPTGDGAWTEYRVSFGTRGGEPESMQLAA